MKLKFSVVIAFVCVLAQLSAGQNAPSGATNPAMAAARAFAKLPLSFEAGAQPGQFVSRSGGYTVALGATEAYVALKDENARAAHILRYAFANANPAAVAEGVQRLPGVVNYYRGSDARNWRLGVPTFAKVRVSQVYPGVDVLYYGDQRRLEFDFVVAPQSDPRAIALNFSGAEKLTLSSGGDLVAEIAGHEFRFAKPYAYQTIAGQPLPVGAAYVLDAAGQARLTLGAYDHSRELVIDPVLTYSTFLGGSQADTANGLAVDAAGNAYVTGQACSSDFIVPSPNPSGTAFVGELGACDAYVTKVNPTGTAVIYTTFIAGALPDPPNATASGNGIAIDATGQAYIVGTTNFWDLPNTSPNPTDRLSAYNGGDSDAFITILSANGTLLRETYLGGSNIDQGYAITVDRQLNVVAAGQTCSSDFPAYNSIQGKVEACVAFITKLDFGLHISRPSIVGASPVSARAASLSDACGFGSACPVTPNASATYYFFSTLFGGQPVPPAATWPAGGLGTHYVTGRVAAPGAITIGTPNCTLNDKPQVLIAVGSGTSAGLTWPCSGAFMNAGIEDAGGFIWVDIGTAPTAVIYATTEAYGVALDPVGDVFAVGGTNTADLTPYMFYAGYRGINYGKTGAWVLKLSGLDGSQIYATALGTEKTADPAQSVNAAKGVAVDSSGHAFIVGTSTGGMITTTGTVSPASIGKQDVFVIKLNTPASAFDYGTYLGGSGDDQGLAIALDTGGTAYIAGSTTSSDLPVANALLDVNHNPVTSRLGPQDAFVAKLTPAGNVTTMMAYLGGAASEQANAIALDHAGNGNIYVAGTTQSVDFPVVPAAPPAPMVLGKSVYGGGTNDGFLALIDGASFPQAAVTPASLNFGDQNVGTSSAAKSITLQNTGSGLLSISSVGFTGTGGAYSQSNDCGTRLSPAGGTKDTCTIHVVFAPGAGGAHSDVLQIVDDSADSPQSVALSGTGVVVQGVLQLTPTSLTFGNQQTGTTSAARTVTVTNTSSTYTATLSSITVTGDFRQTNTCPMSPTPLAANASCTIQVTFAPTAVGAQAVTLTAAGQAANSPQSVTVTGTGVSAGSSGSPDFALTSSAESITSPSTGGNPTFNVFATPANGFNQTLSFTCTVPTGATCTLSPTSLAMDGTSAPSVGVSIKVAGGGTTPPRTADNRYGPRAIFASVLPFCLLGIAIIGKKRRLLILLVVIVIGTLMLSVGCGTSNQPKMTPGTYQVTITGASTGAGAMSHTLSVSLIVN